MFRNGAGWLVWVLFFVGLGIGLFGSYTVGALITCSNGDGMLYDWSCVAPRQVNVCPMADGDIGVYEPGIVQTEPDWFKKDGLIS